MGNTYLIHHGIQGQKWGVRRYQNEDGTLTAAGKARYSDEELASYKSDLLDHYKNDKEKCDAIDKMSDEELAEKKHRTEVTGRIITGVVAAVGLTAAVGIAYKYGAFDRLKKTAQKDGIKAALNNDAVKDAMNDALEDVAYVIRKNSDITRFEAMPDLDISKGDKIAYVAHDKKDVAKYASMLKDWAGTGKRYETKYKATKDIKVANAKAIQKAIDDLWDNDPDYQNNVKETLLKCYTYAYEKSKGRSLFSSEKSAIERQVENEIKKMGTSSSTRLDKISYAMVGKGKDSEKLQKTLMSKGYSAMEDLFDKGGFTDKPMIMLDMSSITKTGESVLTEMMKQKYLRIALYG